MIGNPAHAAIGAHVELLHTLARNAKDETGAAIEGIVTLTRIEGQTARTERFAIGDADEMTQAVIGWSANPGVNLYMPFVIFRKDLPTGAKGGERDVRAVLALVGDLDSDQGKTAVGLDKLPIEPAYVIETSAGNFQPVWPLARALPLSEAKPIAVALSETIGADHCTKDLSHIWRIPGTLNWPTPKKIARGRSPDPQLVTVREPWSGVLIDAKILAAAIEVTGPAIPTGCDTPLEEGEVDAFLEATLPDELLDLVRDGVPVGDRSDGFFRAVKWLKDLQWSRGEILALLKTYPDGIAHKYADRLAAEAIRAYGKPDKPKPVDQDDAATQQAKAAPKLVLSSEEFTCDFVPPDYLWDGILLRGFTYSMTARTGDGKTAVALALTAAVARGGEFAGRAVAPGAVLYFAGENPDDVRMRWIAMAEHLNFDADLIPVHFVPGTFEIAKLEARIRREVEAIGGVVLVIVDTSPAYYTGENENDRIEMRDHAETMRRLHSLPGRPTVITLCHPVKNASSDNLVPAGGGAFLNAMDGNLCISKTDMLVSLHHQGKFRGVEFEPMLFELVSVTARKLVNANGSHMPTVIAKDLTVADQGQKTADIRKDEDAILVLLFERGVALSYLEIATGLHWFTGSNPNKSKVARIMKSLTSGSKLDRLVAVDRDGAVLTKKGTGAAERLIAIREDAKRPDGTSKIIPISRSVF